MTQFLSALYFMPCIICVIWAFIYSFRVKTLTQRMMLCLQLLCVFYFATYAFYILPWTDYEMMVWLDTFNIPVVLSILALDLVFIWTHHSHRLYRSRQHLLLYVPALVLTSVNTIIVYLAGIDNIARFAEAYDRYRTYPPGFDDPHMYLYYSFNIHVLNYVLFAGMLITIACCVWLSRHEGYRPGDVLRFFFRGQRSTPLRVICFLNVMVLLLLIPLVPLGDMGRSYVLNHPALGCSLTMLLSVALFCLNYVEYMNHLPSVTLSSLAHIDLTVSHPATPDVTLAPAATPPGPVAQAPLPVPTDASAATASAPAPIVSEDPGPSPQAVRNEDRDRIEEALRRAFEEENVFKDPELSIIGLAAQLSTNRTTLSQVIAQAYGVNFRQLVARFRIEAAKRYMLEKPEAKQDEVAMECGFGTAQSFNQKFKELTGDAPRMWMVKQSLANSDYGNDN